MSDIDELKRRACERIDSIADELVRISHEIHARPELGHEEVFASDLLVRSAVSHGLPVDLGTFGCTTGFAGEVGSGPTVAVMSEYDALPGLGHACGHNLIAASAVGAGVAEITAASTSLWLR